MPYAKIEWREIEKLRNGTRYRKFVNGKPTNSYKLILGADPVIDEQVGASADDCSWYENAGIPTWSTTSSFVIAGYRTSGLNLYGGGMRFQAVAIPQGATITEAHLTLRCAWATSGTVCRSRIRGEDVDDAAAFSTIGNYEGRTRTTAYVDWDGIPAWVVDTDYQSPEIKTVVQEIVDRGGWASGQDMVIFWDDHNDRSDHNDGAARWARSYDGSATYAPKIHIEYTEGAAAHKDIATRFKLWARNFKDIASRFLIQVQSYKDVSTRFKLWVQGFQDVATRFKLTVGTLAYRDVASRFKLTVQSYIDASARFKLFAQNYLDVAARFVLQARDYVDIPTRFKLWAQSFTDVGTRFRLILWSYKDIATRFKLWVQSYKDAPIRFKLIAQNYVDIATRFRLWGISYRDISARFRLIVRSYKDIATRFKLTVQAFKDVATLFRVVAQEYIDIATRFRIMLQPFIDIATRFRLFSLNHGDVSTRFFLRLHTALELELLKELADLQRRCWAAHFRT